MTEFAGPRALHKLVDAVISLSADLELATVLQRIIDAAMDLVDARYGAIGVLDESRSGLAEFVTAGIDADTHRLIGDLPKGHGILGLLIADPRPLRLPDLRAPSQDAVEDLDVTVKHIRTVIFGLETTSARGDGLRHKAMTLTREASGALGFLPEVTFEGAIDTLVPDDLGREVLATMRE